VVTFEEKPSAPSEISKKFLFEIQQATVSGVVQNLNFIKFFAERWVEGALVTADIIIDSSREPFIEKNPGEANTYNGMYFYEINGKKFSEKISGAIPGIDAKTTLMK